MQSFIAGTGPRNFDAQFFQPDGATPFSIALATSISFGFYLNVSGVMMLQFTQSGNFAGPSYGTGTQPIGAGNGTDGLARWWMNTSALYALFATPGEWEHVCTVSWTNENVICVTPFYLLANM